MREVVNERGQSHFDSQPQPSRGSAPAPPPEVFRFGAASRLEADRPSTAKVLGLVGGIACRVGVLAHRCLQGRCPMKERASTPTLLGYLVTNLLQKRSEIRHRFIIGIVAVV